MDLLKFEKFIKERNGTVSIPEVQAAFRCSYTEAKRAVDYAVTKYQLVYNGGLNYVRGNGFGADSAQCTDGFILCGTEKNEDDDVTSEKNIKKYITEAGGITIPELQQKFNLGFGDAYKIISILVMEKFLTLKDGLTYYPERQNEDDDVSEQFKVLKKRHEELLRLLKSYRGEDGNDNRKGAKRKSKTDPYGEDRQSPKKRAVARRDEDDYIPRRENTESKEEAPKAQREGEDGAQTESGSDGNATRQTGAANNIITRQAVPINNVTEREEWLKKRAAQRLVSTLSSANPAQKLANCLSAVNPVSRLTNALRNISAKKAAQAQLTNSRKNLVTVLNNIAAAQDDKLRNCGSSYSEEYFSYISGAVTMCKVADGKYELKADKVYLYSGFKLKLYLTYSGGKTVLSDGGLLFKYLSADMGKEVAHGRIKREVRFRNKFKFDNGVLFMYTYLKTAANDFFTMYFLMRRISGYF